MSVLTVDETPTRSYREIVRGTPWTSVIALAVLVAYVDGFAMISLRGAVGYIGRAQGPFATWLLHSTLYLPLFVLAVWGSFLLARRWAAGRYSVAVTGGIVVLVTTVLTVAITAANAVYDYQLQAKEMAAMMATGSMPTGMAASLSDSVGVQFTALGVATVVYLVINLVLVGWLTALRGGRLTR